MLVVLLFPALLTMHGRPWYRFLADQDPESGAERLVRDSADARRPVLVDSLVREARRLTDQLATTSAAFRTFVRHDPAADARRLRVAALVVRGSSDRQVPPGDEVRLAEALGHRGAAVTLQQLPGVNHLMLVDPVGDPGLYLTIPDRRLAPGLTEWVVDWLARRWP